MVRAPHLGYLLGLCTLFAVSSPHARPGQTATGPVAGQLIDVSNGEPIADGVLVLRELASREQRIVTTNATGEFRLDERSPAA